MGLNPSSFKAALCMDLDGTLIDHNESAHPRDIEILNHFPKEVLPILATGRSLPSAKGVLRQNGALTQNPLPIASVVINGTVVQLPGEKTIRVEYLKNDVLDELIQLAEIFPSTAFFYYQPTKCYLINSTEAGKHLSEIHYLDAIKSSPEDIPHQINKAMAVDKNLENINQIREHTQGFMAEMGTSLPYIYEFAPLGITKAESVRFLLGEMGLQDLPIYAVGDGETDLTLKSLTKQFFAPSTALENIRQQADVVINPEDSGILTPLLNQIL